MTIDSKLRNLRANIRKQSRNIVEHIIKAHISRDDSIPKPKNEICIFCYSSKGLTKEHLLPKWTFENNLEASFINSVNEQKQSYIKTTVPCCSNCNNNWLGYLERHISDLFRNNLTPSGFKFTGYDLQNIIRWLEIIEYKFQVLEVRRKFKRHKTSDFIEYLADFPISTLVGNGSPFKVISQIRLSLKRVTIKSKEKQMNSLLVFKTKNTGFYFSHNMNEYIFLELPQYKIALFYFYNKVFDSNLDAHNEAMRIIKNIY